VSYLINKEGFKINKKVRLVWAILYYLFLDIKMKQADFLEKVKKELCGYPNIPKALDDYITEATKKGEEESLIPLIVKENERKVVWERIDNRFKKACKITKLSPEKLLIALDFNSKDTSLGQIDAMWAELRTIFFLNDLNLYDIIPLKAINKNNEKSADFIAKGNLHKYVIEVFCKIYKKPKEKFRPITITGQPSNINFKLFQHYIGKALKKTQLDDTAEKYSCDKKIIVMVLDDDYILGPLTNCEYRELLEKISTGLKWGKDYHFSIITGVTTWGISDVENFIYPPIF